MTERIDAFQTQSKGFSLSIKDQEIIPTQPTLIHNVTAQDGFFKSPKKTIPDDFGDALRNAT